MLMSMIIKENIVNPRCVDFLSDSEYHALASSKADRRMYFIGVCCLLAMLAISTGTILF
jgi:hypothetical protein